MTSPPLKSIDSALPIGSHLRHAMPDPDLALALGLVALVLGARTLLAPTLGNQALYLFLIPSVLIAGIVGGWGPGLVATFLSLILHLYLTGEYQNLFTRHSPLFAAELRAQ